MPRISVTGHMNLAKGSYDLVRKAIEERLVSYGPETITGISCLARGADSIFAGAVLARGGKLEVVLPSSGYREMKVKPDHAPVFDELVDMAENVRVMPFDSPDRTAYEAANEVLVGECDRLFAVWDGESTEKGGTGSVVQYARFRHVPVDVIWPAGASRE